MANVNIKFNGKEYLLSCEDGQEEHLEELSLMAFEDPSTNGNPKKINKEDLKLMYEHSISGDLFK